jgi:histone H3/H4
MKKNKSRVNTLIKRKNLIAKLKKSGIKRTSPDAITALEKNISETFNRLIIILKERIVTQGRKTLRKEDVNFALDSLQQEDNYWEV